MSAVLVDVDDTISDTQLVLLETVNHRLGTDFTFEGMTRAHRENGHKVWNEAVWKILDEPDIMATTSPSPGALEAFAELANAGHEAHIVSSRKEPLHAATAEWLERHGFIEHVEMIHPRPSSEKGEAFKVRICREVGFAAAFDDTFEVALAIAPEVPVVYLIDKPWNRGHDEELAPNVVRVDSFAAGVAQFLYTTNGIDVHELV